MLHIDKIIRFIFDTISAELPKLISNEDTSIFRRNQIIGSASNNSKSNDALHSTSRSPGTNKRFFPQKNKYLYELFDLQTTSACIVASCIAFLSFLSDSGGSKYFDHYGRVGNKTVGKVILTARVGPRCCELHVL